MGFDIESVVCATVTIFIGIVFYYVPCMVGEYLVCRLLGACFFVISIIVASWMTLIDELM